MLKVLFSALVGITGLTVATSAQASTFEQTEPLLDIFTAAPLANTEATLARTETGLEINIQTQELPAGAYTLWWDVINNPDACIGVCDLEDIIISLGDTAFNDTIGRSEFWATGGIVGDDGIGNFSAQIDEGELPTGDGQVTAGTGLEDALTADVIGFLRWHGPVNPDLVEEQTTTINGGCSVAEGDGLFACFEPQYVVFPAPETPAEPEAIPEPAAVLGLAILGALGVKSTLKRKLQAH